MVFFFFVFSTIALSLKGNFFTMFFSWIRIRIEKAAGSGSPLKETAGSGSVKNECGSTALIKVNVSVD